MSLAVYAYQDANRVTKHVDENDFTFTGTFSTSGTYTVLDVALYGNTRYIAIVDNIGFNPTKIRPAPRWSPLVLVRAGDVVSAPESFGSIPWNGTVDYDLQGPELQKIDINGNTVIQVANVAEGADMRALLVNATGTDYLVNFASALVWHTSIPGTIPAGKSLLVDFNSFGTVAAAVHVRAWPQI